MALICTVGCSGYRRNLLDPDFFGRTQETMAEIFYNDNTKLTSDYPRLFCDNTNRDSTILVIESDLLVHPSHYLCKHTYSSVTTRLEIAICIPGQLFLEECIECMSERYLPFTNEKSCEDGYSIVAEEFKKDSTYISTEGWVYILNHDREDDYYELKYEYKNVYENRVDSFTRGRMKFLIKK